jgi:tetratricopeptide (TPR) repeat protein
MERAPTAHERDEAEYREAASLERAGDEPAAEALYAGIERHGGERSERAAYARAEIAARKTAETASLSRLRAAVVRFPNSGLARQAAARFVEREAELGGDERALAAIGALLAETRGSEVEESLLYARAQRLERLKREDEAREAYLELARRFPYPRGAYWDDALLAAARSYERAGRHDRAIDCLRALLDQREESRLNGSYERSAYAEARFLMAEIFRDGLYDPLRARATFRRVWQDHPTSRLRDDALFEEALIALRSGDVEGACAPARLLREKEPESRYVGCVTALCPSLNTGAKECRAYLKERIDEARSRLTSTEAHSSSSSR